jgi:hypothetical protein
VGLPSIHVYDTAPLPGVPVRTRPAASSPRHPVCRLWTAWGAGVGRPRPRQRRRGTTSFPQPHVRLARIDLGTWTTVEERQVWHPDYAYAYGCLAVGPKGEIGYGVAVGGKTTFPNACFGILGDYVVYYRDASTVWVPEIVLTAVTCCFAVRRIPG